MSKMSELYPQYYKDASELTEVDVYRICDMFEVGKRDPSGATHHAIKKLLLPGVRTGGKTVQDDVKEARNTLTRRLDMWDEDERIAAERQGKAHHTAITQLKPLIRTTDSGIGYMAGVGNFDDVKQQVWQTVHPGDRIIDFAQRNGLRPYEVRELNPSMRNAGLYDVIGSYWHALRIK